jgi:transcriptional regulator of acetoin/glycerol metabolism
MQNLEREKILRALHKVEGNRSRAARFLGISRATLYEKLKSYNLGP